MLLAPSLPRIQSHRSRLVHSRLPLSQRPSPHPFLRRFVSIRASLIGRVVAASTRHPLIVLLLAVLLTAAALVYTARHFAMTADTSELISTKLEWRQHELAFDRAFPQFSN